MASAAAATAAATDASLLALRAARERLLCRLDLDCSGAAGRDVTAAAAGATAAGGWSVVMGESDDNDTTGSKGSVVDADRSTAANGAMGSTAVRDGVG